ncbi:MAG: hydrogenase [Candidatus Riflebacteria bacterium GWC2_50_8]|nr:MAG: hydrogenase [Candidatus Riflebacteria bacterium GWC2_50_8]
MLKVLAARFQQGFRTVGYPDSPPTTPDRLRGLPVIREDLCQKGCQQCAEVCPTDAIVRDKGLQIDLGRCLFCGACAEACPAGAIQFSNDPRLAVSRREDLIIGKTGIKLASEPARQIFGQSIQLRQVSAGGCNGCEVDINVLTTVVFDLSRFGIKIVASPRHSDGLLITGPVTQNMKSATLDTFAAVPTPKLVVAVGTCAISGGIFRDHAEQNNGATGLLPVDLFIPGCPPHPITILDGLLRLIGRIKEP